jgi:hypothetical protein
MAESEIDTIRALLGSKPRPIGWNERRQRLDAVGSVWPEVDDVRLTPVDAGGVPGEWSSVPGSNAWAPRQFLTYSLCREVPVGPDQLHHLTFEVAQVRHAFVHRNLARSWINRACNVTNCSTNSKTATILCAAKFGRGRQLKRIERYESRLSHDRFLTPGIHSPPLSLE